MDYHLKINEDPVTVTANPGEENSTQIIIGDRVYHVTGSRLDDQHLHLRVNGRGANVFAVANGAGKNIAISGRCHTVDDIDHPSLSSRARKKTTVIPDTVTPPMPSLVAAVLVVPGDDVVKGQSVVVVSAMKMETTLVAPYTGTVTAVKIAVGDKVNPGDVLVDIERMIETDGSME